MNETILVLISLFFIKHFICDFILQGPYQYLNKGEYGHPGGIIHALITITGSAIVLFGFYTFNPMLIILVLALEFIIHYNVDWIKVNITKKFAWDMKCHREFWWLLGFDQLLHYMTYILMIWIILYL